MKAGLFADELARYAILLKKQVTHDTAILRVSTRLDDVQWGELFTTNDKLPQSFCVMVKAQLESTAIKPYTPIEVGPDWLDLLVKGYDGGAVSASLFAKEPSQSVWMQGPRIKFDFQKQLGHPKRLIAFAGGTGIAPIYQVFKAPEVAKLDKILVFANKSEADKLLIPELEQLHNLSIRHVLQDQEGFVTKAHIPACTEENLIFICGPRLFNEHIHALLNPKLKIIKF